MLDTLSIRAMVDRTIGWFGRLDILVNVAGITSLGPAEGLAERGIENLPPGIQKSETHRSVGEGSPITFRMMGRCRAWCAELDGTAMLLNPLAPSFTEQVEWRN
jgi:NAD(P)-dependent dehydrogenase (short-subunit alcohol dehydrogenase family)